MSYELVSIVLPVYRQHDHLEAMLQQHVDALRTFPVPVELVVVVNGPPDGSLELAHALAERWPAIRVVSSEPGWGQAVLAGIAAARGDLLCYTNSARTQAEDLMLILLYAVAYEGTVVKASRKTRDSLARRLGSLVWNLQCRALLDIPNSDINGTPKAFPRSCDALLQLRSGDDLLDLEFVAACSIKAYRLVEVPIVTTDRHGGRSTTNWRTAVGLFVGAFRLARQLRARARERSTP